MAGNRIGFIGLGAMGQPMASNILKKGMPLTVYDIDALRMQPVLALGAAAAESVAEAANDADIVITMLPATQHVEEVVLGADGVLAHMNQGGVLMDMSTMKETGSH